jgi:hypothetical protein
MMSTRERVRIHNSTTSAFSWLASYQCSALLFLIPVQVGVGWLVDTSTVLVTSPPARRGVVLVLVAG